MGSVVVLKAIGLAPPPPVVAKELLRVGQNLPEK